MKPTNDKLDELEQAAERLFWQRFSNDEIKLLIESCAFDIMGRESDKTPEQRAAEEKWERLGGERVLGKAIAALTESELEDGVRQLNEIIARVERGEEWT